jgi:hypothetical protein
MSRTSMRHSLSWLAVSLVPVAVMSAGPHDHTFYPDDPVSTVIDSQDASGVQERRIDVVYDTFENSFSWPGDRTANVRAQNVNTIDEVPDSSWFTNRLGVRRVPLDELARGSGPSTGPPQGTLTVIGAKNDGVMPGFTVRDAVGQVWFLKFDPPGHPAMATGTEVVVARLFWALGYNVAETSLATVRPEDLAISEEARITPPGGRRRRFKKDDVRQLFRRAHRNADGTYRVLASKALEGRPVGPFRFYGTRSDDPNDVIPHEHRRELRAYGTFAAWVNHVDSKAGNTLDTVVEQAGRYVVRHHLLDFGSTLGSAGVYPREPYEGTEYLVEGKQALAGIPSFGFYIKNWRTMPRYRAPSVGAFPADNSQWDPESWKPRYPNSAFRSARLDDKFWAALRLQAFTDDMIGAAIRVGRFNDPRSEERLAQFLIERRDAIVRRYLLAVNPIVDLRLSPDGTMTFSNAAVDAGIAPAPPGYAVEWKLLDNATGATSDLGVTRSKAPRAPAPSLLPPAAGTYLWASISVAGGPDSWSTPAHVVFRREANGWTLIGFQRLPNGNPPGTNAQHSRPERLSGLSKLSH